MGNWKKEHYNYYSEDDDDGSPSFPRKKRERVYFFKWEIELFGRLDNELSDDTPAHKQQEMISRKVRRAVKKLSGDERIFIEKFYFEFKTIKRSPEY